MELTITNEEFKLLRDLIEKECGIALDEDKVYLIESRLINLVIENSCNSFGEFYLKAKGNTEQGLKDKVVDAMTTNETLWFRDEGPFIVLKELLLPEFQSQLKKGERKDIRLWSAACSSGQEPYSIAMVAQELGRLQNMKSLTDGSFTISATDISPSVLQISKNGKYNTLAMSRGLAPELKERYFENVGPLWILKDEIKKMVEFRQFNLQNSFSLMGKFDVVLLRNVAIYFSAEFKIELYKKIFNALSPKGYLFLGSSESLLGYSQDFNKIEHGRYIFYQRKD